MKKEENKKVSTMKVTETMTKSTHPQIEFDNNIHDSAKRIVDAVGDSKPLQDAYSNPILGIENGMPKITDFDSWSLTNDTLNYPLWLSLYNDNWVFKRAIDKPARDMVSFGITVLNQKAAKSKMNVIFDKYKQDFIQLCVLGALFGGSIGVMMFEGLKSEDYEKQVDYTSLKGKAMRLYITDRWYGVSPSSKTVKNFKSLDYGKPLHYNITMTNGKTFKIHHSYILRYEHYKAPPLIKDGMLQGWGYAEGAHIFNALRYDQRIRATIQSLLDKSSLEIIKMSGMRGVFMGADEDNQEQLNKRLESILWARNNNSITFLDKDDDYDRKTDNGSTGWASLLQENRREIESALEMPGILYGNDKGGLTQSNDDIERYAQTVETRQEAFLRYPITKFLQTIYKINEIDEEPDFTFNSINQKLRDYKKLEAVKQYGEFLKSIQETGAITSKQIALAVRDFMNYGIMRIEFTDEEIKKLDDDFEEEMENFDIEKEAEKQKSKQLENLLNKNEK